MLTKILTICLLVMLCSGPVGATHVFTDTLIVQRSGGIEDYGTIDSWINGSSVYRATNYGSGDTMLVVYNPAQWSRSLIKLQAPATLMGPGVTITSATLSIKCKNNILNGYVNIYKCSKPWIENQVTWNEFSTGNGWGGLGCDLSETPCRDNISDRQCDYDDHEIDSVYVTTEGWYTFTLEMDYLNAQYALDSVFSYVLISKTIGNNIFATSEGAVGEEPRWEFQYTVDPDGLNGIDTLFSHRGEVMEAQFVDVDTLFNPCGEDCTDTIVDYRRKNWGGGTLLTIGQRTIEARVRPYSAWVQVQNIPDTNIDSAFFFVSVTTEQAFDDGNLKFYRVLTGPAYEGGQIRDYPEFDTGMTWEHAWAIGDISLDDSLVWDIPNHYTATDSFLLALTGTTAPGYGNHLKSEDFGDLLQFWVDNPDSNFGMYLVFDDFGLDSSKVIATSENSTETRQPYAVVYYQTPTNSLAITDTMWNGFTVVNTLTGSGDSIKCYLSEDSLFANAWLLSEADSTVDHTLTVSNMDPGHSFWLWCRLFDHDLMVDSDSINVRCATIDHAPWDANKWLWQDGDTNRWLGLFGPRRYNWDSSGTWTEIQTNWVKPGVAAEWFDTLRGFYQARVDSNTTTSLTVVFADTHSVEIRLDDVEWFTPSDSATATALEIQINIDSIEQRWDTLIYHSLWYGIDAYFIYGRDGFTHRYIFTQTARDSLDQIFTSGDFLAVKAEHRFVDLNGTVNDESGSFDPAVDWYNVAGNMRFRGSGDAEVTIFKINVDVPVTKDAATQFRGATELNRWYDTSDAKVWFYETIDYELWQDSADGVDIIMDANYTIVVTDSNGCEETMIDAGVPTLNYGRHYLMRAYLNDPAGNPDRYTLLRHLLTSINPTAIIDSTWMSLRISGTVPDSLYLSYLKQPWTQGSDRGRAPTSTPGATWNHYSTTGIFALAWGKAGALDVGVDHGSDTAVIVNDRGVDKFFIFQNATYTGWVQDWVDGTIARNDGVKVSAADGEEWNWYSWDDRSKPGEELTVWYHDPIPGGGEILGRRRKLLLGGY